MTTMPVLRQRLLWSSPPRNWNLETNPTAWWRASTLVLGNGDPVASWVSVNPPAAYDAAEATNRPTYTAAGFNGFPGVDFDGTNDVLSVAGGLHAAVMGTGSYCVVSVVQIDTAGTATAQNGNPFWHFDGGYASQTVSLNGGAYTVHGQHFDGVTGHETASYLIGGALPAVVVMHTRYDAVTDVLTVGVNGVEGTPNTGVLAASMGSTMQFAHSDTTGLFFNGRVAELCFKKDATLPAAFITQTLAEYGL